MKNFKSYVEELQKKIEFSYKEGVTIPEAEKLAAEFLNAMLIVANRLQVVDLDSRMKKVGLKAVKAGVYLEGATAGDKKPSDKLLEAMVDSNETVKTEQETYDTAEVERDQLQNYYNVFREAHVFYRGVSKGRFE